VTNHHCNTQYGRWRFWDHAKVKQSPCRALDIDLRNRTPMALRLGKIMAGKIRELEKVRAGLSLFSFHGMILRFQWMNRAR
jgi:hypothetical protein